MKIKQTNTDQFQPQVVLPADIEVQQILKDIAANRLAFLRVPADLQNDKGFILKAVASNGTIYPFLKDHFQKDTAVIKQAHLSPQSGAFYVSPLIVSDRDTALLLVKHLPSKIAQLSSQFQNDKEIVKYAIFKDPELLVFASEDLQKDEDIQIVAKGVNELVHMLLQETDKQSYLQELREIFMPLAVEIEIALRCQKTRDSSPDLYFKFK